MKFESYMESLFTPKEGKTKASDIHKTLTSIINLPSSFNSKTWDAWENGKDGKAGIPGPFLKILEGSSKGGRAVDIKKLIDKYVSKIKIGDPEQALIVKNIKAEIIKAFETTFDTESSRFKTYTLARKNNLLSVPEDTTILGFNIMPPAKAALEIAQMVKRGDSLSTLRSFINKIGEAKGYVISVIKELKGDKEEEIAALVGQLNTKIGGSSDYELGKLLLAIETKQKVDVFIGTYCKSGSIEPLVDLLSNEALFKSKTGLDVSILPGILSQKGISQAVRNSISDKVLHTSTFKNLMKSVEIQKFIQSKQLELIKNASETGRQPPLVIFDYAIGKELKIKLQGAYEKLLAGVVDINTVSPEYYAQLVSMISSHVINELPLIGDHFKIQEQTIKTKDGSKLVIRAPVLENKPLDTFVDSKYFEDTSVTLIKAKERSTPKSWTEAVSKRLRELTNSMPSEFKVVERLEHYSMSQKVRDRIKYLNSIGKTLDPKTLVDEIYNEHGHIVLGKLFQKALNELGNKQSNFYEESVCIRAILELSKGSGTWRSKHLYLYKQINDMADSLYAEAKDSGDNLDRILEKPRLEEKGEDTRVGRKSDVTRGGKQIVDYGLQDWRDKKDIEKKLRGIDKRAKIYAEFSPPYLNRHGEPASPAIKLLFDIYVNDNKSNSIFQEMVANAPNGIESLFAKWLVSKQGVSRIYDMRESRLRQIDKDPMVAKEILAIEREVYALRYERIQQSLEHSTGYTDKTTGWFVPQKRGRDLDKKADSAVIKTGGFDAAKRDELLDASSAADYLFDLTRKIPEELQSKFKGYSLLGMIHAAETGDELGMVMGHIHTLIPKDHLDTLQENASVKISDVHLEKAGQIEQKANKQRDALQKYSLERQQELQGLHNTPGVTPA